MIKLYNQLAKMYQILLHDTWQFQICHRTGKYVVRKLPCNDTGNNAPNISQVISHIGIWDI